MSNTRPPVTHEFKVSGDADHVELSVGNIVIDPSASPEEIRALRRKQIEDIMKQGGVSVKTVITGNHKSVTTGAYNITFGPQPGNVTSSAKVEKKENNPNITENEKNVTAKVPLTGKGDAIIIVEKTAGKKNDIKITWHVSNFYTGVTIKWDDKQHYKYIEKSGTYNLNASNFDADWKTDQEIATSQKAALSSVSMKPNMNASSNNTSSTFNSTSTSWYSSSSSTVFKANESKTVSPSLVSRPVKLPTVKEIEDILGVTGTVTEVREGMAMLHDALTISFNTKINPNVYEQILNEKLLAGIPNVRLVKTSIFIKLEIPDDAKIYDQFMQNVVSALKDINKSTAKLSST